MHTKEDNLQHHRQSIRLPHYNYASPGAYFITVVSYDRETLFGQVVGSGVQLSVPGEIVQDTWSDLPHHYPHVQLDAITIMPNHVHFVVILVGAGFNPAPTRPAPTEKMHPLAEIVRAFKTFSARRINEWRGMSGVPVWQRNYYEHIVRNEEELNAIRQYIQCNPNMWALDRENATARKTEPELSWHV